MTGVGEPAVVEPKAAAAKAAVVPAVISLDEIRAGMERGDDAGFGVPVYVPEDFAP